MGLTRPPVKWLMAFLLLWGAEAAVLAVLWYHLAFFMWIVVAVGVFLATEAAGIYGQRWGLMPLTQAIRHYLPRWAAFPGLYFLVGAGIARTAHLEHGYAIAALFGLLGWLTAHFDPTYDKPGE